MSKQINISDIRLDAGTQVRLEMDTATINNYADAYAIKDRLPPVDVFNTKGGLILADGFHRVMAASQSGISKIEANVRTGSLNDALKFALGSNSSHGLPRTNEDKRHAVRIALEKFPAMSDRSIAKLCRVSHPFVALIRNPVSAPAATSPVVSYSATEETAREVEESPEVHAARSEKDEVEPEHVKASPAGPSESAIETWWHHAMEKWDASETATVREWIRQWLRKSE